MLEHWRPSLAEVPGFSPVQLEQLTRSIEQKKQRLDDDINNYIRRKQDELRRYEQEVRCCMPLLVAEALLELIGLALRRVPFNGMRRLDSRYQHQRHESGRVVERSFCTESCFATIAITIAIATARRVGRLEEAWAGYG